MTAATANRVLAGTSSTSRVIALRRTAIRVHHQHRLHADVPVHHVDLDSSPARIAPGEGVTAGPRVDHQENPRAHGV